MIMKRRKFLRNSSAISLGSLLLNNLPVKAFATSPISAQFTCEEIQGRILVLVNQQGANDTLNTVIPLAQYDIYANNRPTIKIPTANAILLDGTLPLDKQSYLHPSLAPLKTLYDAGKMNVVHGVGYNNGNRSHFKSDDLWNTAGDSLPENFSYNSGWAGQLFDWRFPGLLGNTNPPPTMPDPPCIEFGVGNGSILFATSSSSNASIFLTKDDASSYYTSLNGLGGQTPEFFPNSDFGNELKYIDDVKKLSNVYGLRLQNVFNAGANANNNYPDTELANQLKTVARLIKGGCKSHVYLVHQYGYDTHGQQVVADSPTTGTHANLLKGLADAIKAFQDDLAALGFEDKVATATYSEFGRTLDENTGRGTDHGEVGTIFIIGKGIKAGITGKPIDLSPQKVFNRGLIDLQYDYRTIWASILQDFMAHGPEGMVAARMQAFTANKVPIIATSHLAPVACYINQVALPVNITTFNAELLLNGEVDVYWLTENEQQCKEYKVEHSSDSINWEAIGIVPSNNIKSATKYQFMHNEPVTGINYYKLIQIDLDGNKRIYGPATVKVKANPDFILKIYPNPATVDFNITITTNKKESGLVQFFDIQGHLLASDPIRIQSGFNKWNYPVTRFKQYKGELLIQIRTQTGVQKISKHLIQ
jgi:uncharacterized protein (DUF1501 family)